MVNSRDRYSFLKIPLDSDKQLDTIHHTETYRTPTGRLNESLPAIQDIPIPSRRGPWYVYLVDGHLEVTDSNPILLDAIFPGRAELVSAGFNDKGFTFREDAESYASFIQEHPNESSPLASYDEDFS